MKFYILSSLIVFLCIKLTAQDSWKESFKISTTDFDYYSGFGSSVDIDADYAVIGVPFDSLSGENSGSAYVYVRNGDSWFQTAKLTASDGEAWDFFGGAVSISGKIIAIGALGDDDQGKGSGAVYIFEEPEGGWKNMHQTAKVTLNEKIDFIRFGEEVSLWGEYLAVASREYDHEDGTEGAAFIFEKRGSQWLQVATLLPSDLAEGAAFGRSIAIYDNIVAVGAYGFSNEGRAGIVYVYEKPETGWENAFESHKLRDSGGGSRVRFGQSVAVSDKYIVASAPGDNEKGRDSGAVYVFEKIFFNWQKTAKLIAPDGQEFEEFGEAIAVSGDNIVVGANSSHLLGFFQGGAYIFKKNNSLWQFDNKISPSDGAEYDQFGWAVAISGGHIIVSSVGGHNEEGFDSGVAYIFDNDELVEKYSTMLFKAYPNPTSGKMKITSDNILHEKDIDIHLIDVNGRVVKSYNRFIGEIDLSDLTKGIYFLKMYQRNGVSSIKRIFKY